MFLLNSVPVFLWELLLKTFSRYTTDKNNFSTANKENRYHSREGLLTMFRREGSLPIGIGSTDIVDMSKSKFFTDVQLEFLNQR